MKTPLLSTRGTPLRSTRGPPLLSTRGALLLPSSRVCTSGQQQDKYSCLARPKPHNGPLSQPSSASQIFCTESLFLFVKESLQSSSESHTSCKRSLSSWCKAVAVFIRVINLLHKTFLLVQNCSRLHHADGKEISFLLVQEYCSLHQSRRLVAQDLFPPGTKL